MRFVFAIITTLGVGMFPALACGQSSTILAVQSQGRISASSVPIEARPDAWRYRWHQGYWWYYTPQQTWLVYQNNAWKPFIVPPPAPVAPMIQAVPASVPSSHVTFGVDSS